MLTLLIGGVTYSKVSADRKLLLSEGQVVTAELVGFRKNDDSRYAIYTYSWNGETVQRRDKVNKSFLRSHGPGDHFPVTIASKHPWIRRIGSFGPQQASAEASESIVLIGGLFALFGLIWLGVRSGAKRNLQTLMDWPATTGQITEVKAVSGEDGKSYIVKYRYQVRGEPMQSKRARFGASRKFKPTVGGFVDVLYNPEKPTQAWLAPQLSMAEIDDGSFR